MFEPEKTVAEPGISSASRQCFRQGETIYTAGGTGKAWRLIAGSIRLDLDTEAASTFAGLAVAGDVIGAETLIFGCYSFAATALSPCVLVSWPEAAESLAGDSLLHTLANSERRAAEVIALRSGMAMERVRHLLVLLTRGGLEILPSLRDMADITSLRLETVSRALGVLRKAGIPGAENVKRGRRSSQLDDTLTAALLS